jgi:hypothetical protein
VTIKTGEVKYRPRNFRFEWFSKTVFPSETHFRWVATPNHKTWHSPVECVAVIIAVFGKSYEIFNG